MCQIGGGNILPSAIGMDMIHRVSKNPDDIFWYNFTDIALVPMKFGIENLHAFSSQLNLKNVR